MKRILIALLLASCFAQSGLAMEPNDEQGKQIEDARELERQSSPQQNEQADDARNLPEALLPVAVDPIEPVVNNDLPMQEIVADVAADANAPAEIIPEMQIVENNDQEGPYNPWLDHTEPQASQNRLNAALFVAIKEENIAEVERLINLKADVNVRYGRFAPLAIAIPSCNEQLIRLLLDHGADVNRPYFLGFTPLMHIITEKFDPILCQLLIDYGADINAFGEGSNETALLQAIRAGDVPASKFLLEHGANPNLAPRPYLSGPLELAISSRNEQLIRLLLEHGADVNNEGPFAGMPLMMLVSEKFDPVLCQLLIDYGADIHAIDKRGETALHKAIKCGDVVASKFLIEHGAILNPDSDISEPCPLELAIGLGNVSIIRLLLAYGADAIMPRRDGVSGLGFSYEHSLDIFREVITNVCINPYRLDADLLKSQKRMVLVLWALKHARPCLPKDVRALIFQADPELWQDFCSSPFGSLHAGRYERIPCMPFPVISALINGKKFSPNRVVRVIQAHTFKRLRPEMAFIFECAQSDDEMKAILNPENLESNFGDDIAKNSRTRLGLPLEPQPEPENPAPGLQPQRRPGMADLSPMATPYQVLGLADTASADDIKKAYRNLARIYHPDKFEDNKALLAEAKIATGDEATTAFQMISDAYDKLKPQ